MAGAISDELIMRLTLQYEDFIKGMRESKEALKQFQTASAPSGTMVSGLKNQFGQINQFYKLTGDSAGAVKEKMSLLSNTMRDMVSKGQGNSDMAQRLSGVYKSLSQQSAGVGKGLGGIVQSLARSTPGLSGVTNVMDKVGAAFPKLAAAAGPVGVAVMAIAAAYKYVIIPGVQFNAMLEQQSIAFTSMLKSGDKATLMLEDLKQLSLTTPIGLGESTASAKQMLAYGFAQDEIVTNMKMMKTVASAVNVSLSDLTYVYGTLRAQGRAYTRDLMQFAMRGIPIYEYLAKTMNVSVSELKSMTEAGRIGFKEVEKAMQAMTGEGGKFNGMLERSMDTTQGLKTQISNTWQMFTGEAAEGSSAVFKGLLKDVLSLVRGLQGIAPTFNVLFSIISFLLAAVVKAVIALQAALVFTVKLVQNLVLSMGDALKKAGDWVAETLKIDESNKRMAEGAKDFGSWLLDTIPILRDIGEWCTSIGVAIEKWWNRDKNKKDELLPEFVIGEVDATITRVEGRYQQMQLLFNRPVIKPSQLATWAKQMGVPLESALKAIANFRQLTKKEYDELLRNMQNFLTTNKNYWGVYKDAISTEMENSLISATASVGDALAKVESQLRSSSGLTGAIDMAKLLGLDPAEAKEALNKSAGEIADTLYSQIESMRNMLVYQSGEGKTFLDGLIEMWKKYNVMAEKEGSGSAKTTKSALDDILQQYLEFRAEWGTNEKGFGETLTNALNERLGSAITGDTTMLDRRLALITQKFGEMRTKLRAEKGLDAYFFLPMVQAMEDAEIAAATLGAELEKLQAMQGTAGTGKETIYLMERELEIQMELNKLAAISGEDRLKNEQAIVDLQAKLVELYKKGDQAAYDREMNRMVVNGRESGDSTQLAAGIGGQAIAGTDLGKLIGGIMGSGIDPMVAALTYLADMLMSMESVQEVVNFVGTALAGLASMIDGPLKKALAPLSSVFSKIGEALGAMLIPFIEMAGDFINIAAPIITIVAELLKRLFMALKPLIKIMMYVANPLLWLGRLLGDLASALGSFLATEEDRQKELEDLYDKELATLQNLYEVGALSGAEYEARLAELKARYAKDDEPIPADPAMLSFLKDIFDAISEMGVALDALFKACIPIFDMFIALLKPVLMLCVQLLGGLFRDIANLVTSISKLATDILTGNWSGVWASFKAVLWSILAFFVNPIITALNWFIDGLNWLIIGSDPLQHVPLLETGTGLIPNDMMAYLHQGESVIPKTFMDSIRSGNLALSAPGGGSGSTIIVNVYNEGSVITERDLNRTIYTGISSMLKRGHL
jgi:uncharacterized protein YukE